MSSTSSAAPALADGAALDDYDVVVFDCDGVLLDSNALKSQAFRKVLEQHGYAEDEISAFIEFQRRNFGTSRYRLFEAVAAGQFGPIRGIPCDQLVADFGVLCRTGYLEQPETPGMRDALVRAGADGRTLYVVSGSDQAELIEVLTERGFASDFAQIFGSPTTKVDNMRKVRALHADAARVLFVGDAEADMNAALETGADFLFMAAFSTVRPTLEKRAREAGCVVIEDLRELR